MANNILQLSSTLAAQRTQQLFQEMESEESIFRNAVMMVSSVIEDIKTEETAVSRRIREQSVNRANNIRTLSETEAALVDQRYRNRERQLNSRINGNNVIRDPQQWGFPDINNTLRTFRSKHTKHSYNNISRDYLWMLNLALR